MTLAKALDACQEMDGWQMAVTVPDGRFTAIRKRDKRGKPSVTLFQIGTLNSHLGTNIGGGVKKVELRHELQDWRPGWNQPGDMV